MHKYRQLPVPQGSMLHIIYIIIRVAGVRLNHYLLWYWATVKLFLLHEHSVGHLDEEWLGFMFLFFN